MATFSRSFAAEYLKAAIEDTDEPEVLLIALRQIAEARGGVAKVAKAASIERKSLYKAVSANGNPRLFDNCRSHEGRRPETHG